jgi:dihydrofolate reductase
MESILAVDINNGLSKHGNIPWKSKKDMKFFYNKTKNNVVIMGRNTYFSLPKEYRPLKNRLNIVLTTQQLNNPDDTVIFTNDDTIFNLILSNREKYIELYPSLSRDFKIFFIGGKKVYEQFIPLCETVWVTRIKQNYSCDLFFDYDYSKQFKEKIIDEDDDLQIIQYSKN